MPEVSYLQLAASSVVQEIVTLDAVTSLDGDNPDITGGVVSEEVEDREEASLET
jgi:hypothetical protein